jgi:predicted transcriptional regulator
MTFEADNPDMAREAETIQVEEVRRRLVSRTGETIPNERVVAWLDTWGRDDETFPWACE